MTAVAATTPENALLETPQMVKAPAAETLVKVARKYSVSPIRQLREAMMLSLGKSRLYLNEYYSTGVFDPDLSWEEKKQYVGMRSSWSLNEWLSPSPLNGALNFVSDKVMYTSLIRQLGFRTTETQAIFSNNRRSGNIPALATQGELRRFLTEQALFPLFGKPQSYSGSFGSALLDRIEDGQVVLGNGQRVDLDAFCAEIEREYGEGYLFQTALQQHPDITAMIGNAVGTLRVVTVREETMPHVLYALWKIPSPRAMSDNFWQSGSMIAPLDKETGTVGRCRIGTGPDATDIEQHPVSGVTFEGFRIPHWEEACRMASEAHALFPEFGVIGWDVCITPDGPALIECNDNPFHSLYQLAFRRGIRNPEIMPTLTKVAAHSKKLMDEKKARIKSRKKMQSTGKTS